MPPDKTELFAALRAHLETVRDDLKRSRAQAADGMRVDGSHRPANRGERGAVTSAGYLAAGIEARIAEVDAALELLDRTPPTPRERVVTGAVVTVESDDQTRTWLVFPGLSGVVLGAVTAISPESPVGRALWELEEGDEAELPRLGEAAITAVY